MTNATSSLAVSKDFPSQIILAVELVQVNFSDDGLAHVYRQVPNRSEIVDQSLVSLISLLCGILDVTNHFRPTVAGKADLISRIF